MTDRTPLHPHVTDFAKNWCMGLSYLPKSLVQIIHLYVLYFLSNWGLKISGGVNPPF